METLPIEEMPIKFARLASLRTMLKLEERQFLALDNVMWYYKSNLIIIGGALQLPAYGLICQTEKLN